MTTDTITFNRPDGESIERRAQGFLRFVRAFEIECDDDYTVAGEELRSVKAKANALTEQQDEITGPIRKGLDAIYDLFRGPRGALLEAEKMLKAKMIGWQEKKEAEAALARRKAEALAEAERQRLAKEAAEVKARAEAEVARLRAEVNPETGEIPSEAIERVHQTALFEAEAMRSAAALIVAAPVAAPVPKIAGNSTAKALEGMVTNKLALVSFILDNYKTRPELLDLILIDGIRLKNHVKASGKNLGFPGVEVRERTTMRQAS
jgi:hypothetical protein